MGPRPCWSSACNPARSCERHTTSASHGRIAGLKGRPATLGGAKAQGGRAEGRGGSNPLDKADTPAAPAFRSGLRRPQLPPRRHRAHDRGRQHGHGGHHRTAGDAHQREPRQPAQPPAQPRRDRGLRPRSRSHPAHGRGHHRRLPPRPPRPAPTTSTKERSTSPSTATGASKQPAAWAWPPSRFASTTRESAPTRPSSRPRSSRTTTATT